MTEKIEIEKVWYTHKEVAHYLGVCEATLWRWRKDKRFPNPSMRFKRSGKYRGGRYNINMVESFMRHKL